MMRIGRMLMVLGVCLPLLLVIQARPASAVNWNKACNFAETSFKFVFSSDSEWNQVVQGKSKKDWAADGIYDWNQTLDYDGTNLAAVLQNSGARTITLAFQSGSGSANASCSTNTINVPAGITDGERLQITAAHEFGHILGLKHVGMNSSYDLLIPHMHACPPVNDPWHLDYAQDDESALFHQRDSGGQGTSANPGFERDAKYWGVRDGLFSIHSGSGAYAGSKYSSFLPENTSTSSLYITTAISHAPGSTGWSVRGAFRAPVAVSGLLTLEVQRTDNVSGEDGGCPYAASPWDGDKDENTLTRPGAFSTSDYKNHNVTASWSFKWTDTFVANIQFQSIRLRLTENLRDSNNTLRGIYIDNLRLRNP